MSGVHDRMPVTVPEDRWSEWLDPANQDITELSTLFVRDDDRSLEMYEVSTDVNNVRNNEARLIDPL